MDLYTQVEISVYNEIFPMQNFPRQVKDHSTGEKEIRKK
jgi:hypothetical protein